MSAGIFKNTTSVAAGNVKAQFLANAFCLSGPKWCLRRASSIVLRAFAATYVVRMRVKRGSGCGVSYRNRWVVRNLKFRWSFLSKMR